MADRGWKPTATFGGRSATKNRTNRRLSFPVHIDQFQPNKLASSLQFVRFQWSLTRTSNSEHADFVANNHEHAAIASAAVSLE